MNQNEVPPGPQAPPNPTREEREAGWKKRWSGYSLVEKLRHLSDHGGYSYETLAEAAIAIEMQARQLSEQAEEIARLRRIVSPNGKRIDDFFIETLDGVLQRETMFATGEIDAILESVHNADNAIAPDYAEAVQAASRHQEEGEG